MEIYYEIRTALNDSTCRRSSGILGFSQNLAPFDVGWLCTQRCYLIIFAETGHTVEVTTSNNEEMIAKLRATNGCGFDLEQPSQDRTAIATYLMDQPDK